MPVVSADYDEIVALIGRRLPKEDLIARIPMMGGAYEGTDDQGRLLFEFFPNRPDLLSVEGLARAASAFFDVQPGLRTYLAQASGDTVTVDPSVAKIRPFIGFARVTNVVLNEARLAQLIELQERLTVGPGRKRAKVAIGIHDAAPVQGPFTYKAVGRDEVKFVPLAMTEPMTPVQIFEKHEKGRLYAHLLKDAKKVPLIVDKDGNVLSLPPIINGQLTALSTQTREVLVDVTGTDERAVMGVLNIVCTSLADRGGQIHSFQVVEGPKARTTPDLAPQQMKLPYSRIKQLLGLKLDHASARTYLARLGHDMVPAGDAAATVQSPSYRLDLLHPDDLVEDVGIGYGFDKFQPRLPDQALFGGLVPRTKTMRRARTALLGLGFTEVVTLSVANRRDVFELMGRKPVPVVEIANPVTQDTALVRPDLLPSLLGILRVNKHRELPQSVFEVGTIIPDPDAGAKTQLRVAAVRISPATNFSECKSLVESVLRDLGIAATFHSAGVAGFIDGRAAVLRGPEGAELGHFGELRPDVIINFELGAPVVGLEIRL